MKGSALINLLRLLPALVLLAIWQIAANQWPKLDFTTGSPSGIMREFQVLLSAGTLFRDFGVTLAEAVLGFLAGTAVGTVVGLLLWSMRTAYDVLRPYLLALGALPIVALGPMMIFWFGTGMLSKVVLGFLATVVIAITQSYTGAREADSDLLKMVQAFGGTRRQAFWKIVLPSAALWVVAGVRINVSMALLGAFVGEFIASRMGAGESHHHGGGALQREPDLGRYRGDSSDSISTPSGYFSARTVGEQTETNTQLKEQTYGMSNCRQQTARETLARTRHRTALPRQTARVHSGI